MTASIKVCASAVSILASCWALAGPAAAEDPTVKMLLPTDQEALVTVMQPGKGLSLDFGGKHTMSYFESKDGGCNLMVVLTAQDGGMTGNDSPGTRINMPVAPGASVKIDAPASKTAVFQCSPKGDKMNARVFDREPYQKKS